MPQKKNPDAAELLRAKAPRVLSDLVALHGVMHGLPLTYNKDMQEDKERLFDACDTLELCLDAARGMLETITFKRDRLAAAASDQFLAATDIADLLVKRGMPFREAHGVVAGLVRQADLPEQAAVRPDPGGTGRPEPPARRGLLPDPAGRRVAGEQGVGGRDQPGPRARAAGPGPRRPDVSPPGARSRCGAAHPHRGAGGLGAAFYDRPVVDVARDLVGCLLSHGETAGVIVETEAYHDSEPACHAYVGLTSRTSTLFGSPGIAYVYRSYGIHALLNAVCEDEEVGAAVLIRALEPVAGLELMRLRRGMRSRDRDLCSGPGKLTQALDIELRDNRSDLSHGPVRISARPSGWTRSADRRRPPDRHHTGRGAAVAVLCGRQPVSLPAALALVRAARRITPQTPA